MQGEFYWQRRYRRVFAAYCLWSFKVNSNFQLEVNGDITQHFFLSKFMKGPGFMVRPWVSGWGGADGKLAGGEVKELRGWGIGEIMHLESKISRNPKTVVLENLAVSWELKSQPLPAWMLPEPGIPGQKESQKPEAASSTSGQLRL